LGGSSWAKERRKKGPIYLLTIRKRGRERNLFWSNGENFPVSAGESQEKEGGGDSFDLKAGKKRRISINNM